VVDPTDRTSAFIILRNFQKNLPLLIDEECVDQYHEIIQSLEKTENLNLEEFKIDPAKLSFKIVVAAQTVHRYPPSRIQYSNKRYCDSDYLRGKLDGLRVFLSQTKDL
jgi:hypothetical protein